MHLFLPYAGWPFQRGSLSRWYCFSSLCSSSLHSRWSLLYIWWAFLACMAFSEKDACFVDHSIISALQKVFSVFWSAVWRHMPKPVSLVTQVVNCDCEFSLKTINKRWEYQEKHFTWVKFKDCFKELLGSCSWGISHSVQKCNPIATSKYLT